MNGWQTLLQMMKRRIRRGFIAISIFTNCSALGVRAVKHPLKERWLWRVALNGTSATSSVPSVVM
jgi:hypothetical protein